MKYCNYRLDFEGDEGVLAFIKPYLPETFDSIAEANAKRRAIHKLFDGAVKCEIVSVRRIPARVQRRTLKI